MLRGWPAIRSPRPGARGARGARSRPAGSIDRGALARPWPRRRLLGAAGGRRAAKRWVARFVRGRDTCLCFCCKTLWTLRLHEFAGCFAGCSKCSCLARLAKFLRTRQIRQNASYIFACACALQQCSFFTSVRCEELAACKTLERGISLPYPAWFRSRRKIGASGQFHILTGVVPKEGGACESL